MLARGGPVHEAGGRPVAHVRHMYGGGFPGGRPGGMQGGFPGGRPGMPQPGGGIDFGTIFLGLVVLSFIPGPWQIILGPLFNLINLYYIFKFLGFFIPVALIGGLAAWQNFTTIEAQCPQCGFPQRGPKDDPFQCMNCGEQIKAEGEIFTKYMKSGAVPKTPVENIQDFVSQARAPQPKAAKGPPSKSDVVDAEVVDKA